MSNGGLPALLPCLIAALLPMAMPAALTRMAAAAKKFDLSSVRPGDLALVAAVSTDE